MFRNTFRKSALSMGMELAPATQVSLLAVGATPFPPAQPAAPINTLTCTSIVNCSQRLVLASHMQLKPALNTPPAAEKSLILKTESS